MGVQRFIGLLFLAAVFVYRGWDLIEHTKERSRTPMGQFNYLLSLSPLQFRLIKTYADQSVRYFGVAFIWVGLCISLGFAKRFFLFVGAFLLIGFTCLEHVNLRDPRATVENDIAHILKAVSIVGGLVVAAC